METLFQSNLTQETHRQLQVSLLETLISSKSTQETFMETVLNLLHWTLALVLLRIKWAKFKQLRTEQTSSSLGLSQYPTGHQSQLIKFCSKTRPTHLTLYGLSPAAVTELTQLPSLLSVALYQWLSSLQTESSLLETWFKLKYKQWILKAGQFFHFQTLLE